MIILDSRNMVMQIILPTIITLYAKNICSRFVSIGKKSIKKNIKGDFLLFKICIFLRLFVFLPQI